MDLEQPLLYRGIDFTSAALATAGQPISGIVVRRLNYSDVNGEGYREKRALDDGYDAGDVFLGMRPVTIDGTLYGATQDDFWDRMQTLRAACTPTLAFADEPGDLGFLPLTFYQRTARTEWPAITLPRGAIVARAIPLEIRVRPQAQPHFLLDRDRMQGQAEYGYSCEFSAQFWARDPRIYVQTPEIDAITGTTGPFTGTLINRGDYPSPVDFMLNVTAAGVKTFTFSGLATKFTVTIPDGASPRLVRVDSHLRVVTLQTEETETLRMDLIAFDAGMTWPVVPERTLTGAGYTWTSTGTIAAGSQIFHNEAFA